MDIMILDSKPNKHKSFLFYLHSGMIMGQNESEDLISFAAPAVICCNLRILMGYKAGKKPVETSDP